MAAAAVDVNAIPFPRLAALMEDVETSPLKPAGRVRALFSDGLRQAFQVSKSAHCAQFPHPLHGGTPQDGVDILPYVRLILPSIDSSRVYNIKEAVLASCVSRHGCPKRRTHTLARPRSFVAKGMAWPAKGKNAERLRYFTREAKRGPSGEFGKVLAYLLSASGHAAQRPVTVGQVNVLLDALRDGIDDKEAQQRVVLHMLQGCGPVEMKWLARIVLKQGMHLRVKENSFFKWLHPDAAAVYKTRTSLAETLAVPALRDPTTRQVPLLQLGQRFSPQHCEGWHVDLLHAAPEALLGGQDAIIEEKLDGERSLVHAAWEGGRHRLQLFSRVGNERPKLLRALKPALLQVLPPGVSAVLDGETVAWDAGQGGAGGHLLPFGRNLAVAEAQAAAAAAGAPLPQVRLLFRVFDLVFLSGWPQHPEYTGCISHLPLLTRRQLLVALLGRGVQAGAGGAAAPSALNTPPGAPLPGEVEVHPVTALPGSLGLKTRWAAVRGAFESVLEAGGEGVVLKRLSAPYACGGRAKAGWLKVKPEYMQGYYDTLDMVAVAAWNGAGHRRAGLLSHFLLAVRDEAGGTTAVPAPAPLSLSLPFSQPSASQGAAQRTVPMPRRWRVVAKVGTGYSREELRSLHSRLRAAATPVRGSKAEAEAAAAGGGGRVLHPGSLPASVFGRTWLPRGDMVPDVVINPSCSVVMEVVGAQFLRERETSPGQHKYPEGVTLRFPRVLRIREDKGVWEASTWAEVQACVAGRGGRLPQRVREARKRRGGQGGAARPAAKRRAVAAGSAGVPADLRPVAACGARDAIRPLQGRAVYVPAVHPSLYAGAPPGLRSTADVQRAVLAMGGRPVMTLRKGDGHVLGVVPAAAVHTAVVRGALGPGFAHRVDLLRPAWLAQCRAAGALVPLEPSHAVHLSDASKADMQGRADLATGVVWHRAMAAEEVAAALAAWQAAHPQVCSPASPAALATALGCPATALHTGSATALASHDGAVPSGVLAAAPLEVQAAVLSPSTVLSWSPVVLFFDRGGAGAFSADPAVLDTQQAEVAWRRAGGHVAPALSPHVTLIVSERGDPARFDALVAAAPPSVATVAPSWVTAAVRCASSSLPPVLEQALSWSDRVAAVAAVRGCDLLTAVPPTAHPVTAGE